MSAEPGYGNGPLIHNGETITHPNLYVRNLPPNMDQTAVEVLFRRFGSCTGCKFFKNAAVPYAFLRLSSPAEALAAIKALNGTTVSGKIILVKPADADAVYDAPNENLYVRNIPVSWNEEDIRQFFEKYGPLVSVRVLPPIPTSVGQVAMVRFQQLEHAQTARDGANATIPKGESLPLNVKFADNQDEKARKQQSRLVKSGGSGAIPGGPAQFRFAPYPGASGPPGFPPPGMQLPMGPGMMVTTESGEMVPFAPGGPGAPPLEALGPMGMGPPPPWAAAESPAMFNVQPPPPPPPRPQQQQVQPQPPLLAIAVDGTPSQFLMPAGGPFPGGPGTIRSQQPQPGPVPIVPVQALPPVQPQPLPTVPPQQQQPRPAMQPQQQPPPQQVGQHTPGQSTQPQPQPQMPPMPGAGDPPQAVQGTYPTPHGAPAAAAAAAAAPAPYTGYDPHSAQHHYPQPAYGTAPYAYPTYPYTPAPGQQQSDPQQAYDAQAAAYYTAYYGQPPPTYSQPPQQPSAGAAGQQQQPGGQAPGQPPAGSTPADPYQAYYYYQQYYGTMAQQQQQQQQPQSQPPPQQQQQPYQQPVQVNGIVASGTGPAAAAVPAAYSAPAAAQPAPTQQPGGTAAGGSAAVTVAQPKQPLSQQPQPQQSAAPWHMQQQQPPQQQLLQGQQTSLATAAQSVPAVPTGSTQPVGHVNGAATPAAGVPVSGYPSSVASVAATGNSDRAGSFKPNCRVMVSNLPANMEKVHMYESFSPYGAVVAVHVTGGFGVVQYADRESAARAAAAMNGAELRGARIKAVVPEP